jgi:hypothetical protein
MARNNIRVRVKKIKRRLVVATLEAEDTSETDGT